MAAAAMACEDASRELLIASTTSTEDSGLFDVLLPAFEREYPGHRVRVTAVGTGQALGLGRRKDADVLLVHAPPVESTFVAEGHGTVRCEVMYNDFIIVGPAADPAGVAASADSGEDRRPDAAAALRRIADAGRVFVSRGDDSGTHLKELSLWRAVDVDPRGQPWYQEVGQGMTEALRMASEQRAYTLTDRATYLKQAGGLELAVLLEGDDRLFNQYGVIPVTGARRPGAAADFARWITGREGQRLIAEYGVDQFGRPLFVANSPGCSVPEGDR